MTLAIKSAALALGGEVTGRSSIHCPGPGHSRRDRSLQVTFKPDGSFVCRSFAGDDWRDCRDHVKAMLGLSNNAPRRVAVNDNVPRVDFAAVADERERIRRGMRIWGEAQPFRCTPASAYILHRVGATYSGEALRFHPSCHFRQERHPAMVGLMTDAVTGEPVGVHRTAIKPDGRGKAAPGKMMLGRAKGAVVRLYGDDDVTYGVGLAEGIETALATGFQPIWACLSAGSMREFPVLSGVDFLTIWADADKAGVDAANACGERWHSTGAEVVIATPPLRGQDFADREVA